MTKYKAASRFHIASTRGSVLRLVWKGENSLVGDLSSSFMGKRKKIFMENHNFIFYVCIKVNKQIKNKKKDNVTRRKCCYSASLTAAAAAAVGGKQISGLFVSIVHA